jgi:hypothetical protein
LTYPKHLERAAELLGEKHYMYNDIKAKEYYFRARGIVIANNFSTIHWDSSEISELGEHVNKGLGYDSIAPYLFFLKSYYFNARRWSNLDSKKYSYQREAECLQRAIELAPTWTFAQTKLESIVIESEIDRDVHNFEVIKRNAKKSIESMELRGITNQSLELLGDQY